MSDLNRDLIARRIRALQAKTVANGCTEEEAMLAAEKVGEMMAQYHLTQTDLEFQADPIELRTVDRRQRQKEVSEDHCVRAISRYCGVRCWFRTEGDRRKLVIFGNRADSDHAEWLYKMIGPTIMAAAEVFKAANRDSYPNMTLFRRAILDFRIGMAQRISRRLIEMAIAMEPVAKTASGTALVVVRNAVVDQAFRDLNLTFGRSSSRGYRVGDAYAQGAAAGDKVSLNRPVGSTTRGRLS
jgi:hypothetical protein